MGRLGKIGLRGVFWVGWGVGTWECVPARPLFVRTLSACGRCLVCCLTAPRRPPPGYKRRRPLNGRRASSRRRRGALLAAVAPARRRVPTMPCGCLNPGTDLTCPRTPLCRISAADLGEPTMPPEDAAFTPGENDEEVHVPEDYRECLECHLQGIFKHRKGRCPTCWQFHYKEVGFLFFSMLGTRMTVCGHARACGCVLVVPPLARAGEDVGLGVGTDVALVVLRVGMQLQDTDTLTAGDPEPVWHTRQFRSRYNAVQRFREMHRAWWIRHTAERRAAGVAKARAKRAGTTGLPQAAGTPAAAAGSSMPAAPTAQAPPVRSVVVVLNTPVAPAASAPAATPASHAHAPAATPAAATGAAAAADPDPGSYGDDNFIWEVEAIKGHDFPDPPDKVTFLCQFENVRFSKSAPNWLTLGELEGSHELVSDYVRDGLVRERKIRGGDNDRDPFHKVVLRHPGEDCCVAGFAMRAGALHARALQHAWSFTFPGLYCLRRLLLHRAQVHWGAVQGVLGQARG